MLRPPCQVSKGRTCLLTIFLGLSVKAFIIPTQRRMTNCEMWSRYIFWHNDVFVVVVIVDVLFVLGGGGGGGIECDSSRYLLFLFVTVNWCQMSFNALAQVLCSSVSWNTMTKRLCLTCHSTTWACWKRDHWHHLLVLYWPGMLMIRSSPTGSSQILETSSLSATMQVGCGRSYAIFIYTHAGTFANIDTGNLRAPLLTKACWQSIQGETLHYRHYIFHLGPVLGYIYILLLLQF